MGTLFVEETDDTLTGSDELYRCFYFLRDEDLMHKLHILLSSWVVIRLTFQYLFLFQMKLM